MSLTFESYKLAKLFDEKYSNHYVSKIIFSEWCKDLHKFPQFNLKKMRFVKIKDRPIDIQNIKNFVNKHFKNQILKSICVLSIEKKQFFLDHRLIEREITLFLSDFKKSIKKHRHREDMQHVDDALFFSLMDYIDGYLKNTYTESWNSLN